jgi:Suppressor of fused protein (SUFU)
MKSALEDVWEHREEVIYPRLFGSKARGIFVLDFDLFTNTFKQENVDPRWLHYGVLEHGPTDRGTYHYVTSGASNPWEVEPEDYSKQEFSGFGTELVLETLESAEWPIVVLQRVLAFNILLAHGRYGDSKPLDYWHRVPLGGSITRDSVLHHVLIAPPNSYSAQFSLSSGKVDLLHVVGITEKEREYAKTNGSEALLKLLKERDAFPVTDPDRTCIAP